MRNIFDDQHMNIRGFLPTTPLGYVTLIIAIVFLIFCLFVGFTDKKTTQRVLEQNGYTSIHLDGYAWFACSDRDWFATKFYATSPSGSRVTGAVCSGLLFKNATIRFE